MSNKTTEMFPPYPSPFKTSDGVEFVPVVRCKNCKWWSEEPEFDWDGETILTERICEKHDCYIEPDDYCSWGEKKCGSP